MSITSSSLEYKLSDAALQPSFTEQKKWATASAQETERHRVDSASVCDVPPAHAEKCGGFACAQYQHKLIKPNASNPHNQVA